MPTYDYRCDSCSGELSHVKGMSEPHPKECPFCGKPTLSRVFSAPNLITSGKAVKEPPDVSKKMEPTGQFGSSPCWAPHRESGLHAISHVGGRGWVIHPNLAGPPPGCDSRNGRIFLVEDKTKEISNKSEKKE